MTHKLLQEGRIPQEKVLQDLKRGHLLNMIQNTPIHIIIILNIYFYTFKNIFILNLIFSKVNNFFAKSQLNQFYPPDLHTKDTNTLLFQLAYFLFVFG